MAKEIGRSKTVVYKYLPSIWEKPRWTEHELEEVISGYEKNRSIKKIAQKTGRTPTAVKVAMCRYRKKVKEDPKIREIVGYLTKAFRMGVKPGQAITAMRRADIIGRYNNAL